MRAPISIVIPTLNSQNTVRKTLASLFEGIEAGIVRELIVVNLSQAKPPEAIN